MGIGVCPSWELDQVAQHGQPCRGKVSPSAECSLRGCDDSGPDPVVVERNEEILAKPKSTSVCGYLGCP